MTSGGTTCSTDALVLAVPNGLKNCTGNAPRVALAAIVKVAEACVALSTFRLPTETPVVLTIAVSPLKKLVPVNVTVFDVPCRRLGGLAELAVGAGASWESV